MEVALRPATPEDIPFLVELANDSETEPYLSARQPRGAEAIAAELERVLAEPDRGGRLVIEVDGARAGTVAWQLVNERNSIVRLERLAVAAPFRGRGVGAAASRLLQQELLVERGFHRLELEVYAFNEGALELARRVGYVEEGRRRRAYSRHGRWNDALLYGMLREDLDEAVAHDLLEDHVRRFNDGVRTGDWAPMLARFTDDAELVFEGVPAGTFRGLDTIAEVYRDRPPDDTIAVLDERVDGDEVVAGYAWGREPDVRAGELRLTRDGEHIRRLVVTFDQA
jgi:RimJ/RimL family protein N-acetyltransferase